MTMDASSVDRRSTPCNTGARRLSVAGIADGPVASAVPADPRVPNAAHRAIDGGPTFLAEPEGMKLGAVAMQRSELTPARSMVATAASDVASHLVAWLIAGMSDIFRLGPVDGGHADSQPVGVRATAHPDVTQAGDEARNSASRTAARSMRRHSSVAGQGLSQRTSGPAWSPSANVQALA